MKAYETMTTVQPAGELRLDGVPFAPGTEVEVTITPKRRSAEEFAAAWAHVCGQMRSDTSEITEQEIESEIEGYRAGA